jgi:uncharacterized protein (DUF2062 family)
MKQKDKYEDIWGDGFLKGMLAGGIVAALMFILAWSITH